VLIHIIANQMICCVVCTNTTDVYVGS